MSVNEWGGLQEPTLPVPSEAEPSRSEDRADRSSPGAWDEDLGNYGSDEWLLPGFGEKGPKCGEWYAESVCDECGHLGLGTHHCGRKMCPRCWGIWAQEAGVRATKRIQAFRHTLPDNHERQVAHASVSPPEGSVMNERQVYQGRKKAAEIAREKGFRAFAVIVHPYRVTEEAKQEWREKVERDESGDPVIGIWVWLRNEFEWCEIEERVYWSPHYHIIGVTTADMEPGKDSDEWLYNFIRSLAPYEGIRDGESHNDLYGAFRYLLSHTGQPASSSKQSVTWYGELANSVFVEDATEEWQREKPSEGIRSALLREIEAVAGPTDIEDDESDESGAQDDGADDVGECPCDDCDGVLIDVFDVRDYLRHNEPPPEVAKRMEAAYEWRVGDRAPPPGMKHPQSEAEAREAFEELLTRSAY